MEETASGDTCQNLCEKANEDVISELRDDILCYMLSFLPTKSAVATSILSTRWRNLWKSVTILDIYDGISGFFCIICVPYDHRYRKKLTIDTPNLEFLKLVDFASEELSMKRADSLLQADLCFGYHADAFNVGIEEYANMVVQFYRQISGVKTLSLSNFNIETLLGAAVSKFPCLGNLPTFRNLIHLEVLVFDAYVWILPEILQCTSNLEVFVFILDEDAYDWNWCAPHSVPQCLSSCLQVIEFNDFEGVSGETEMVEYFLRNALVLKKMTITYLTDLKTSEVDVLKRLSTCPKGSDACHIVIIPEHETTEVANRRRACSRRLATENY
ncbi:hypothetical protein OIU84_002997 [Salix udensis]|uniref:FBD domain-containing protein n=1 Tax=Salix udensis TaxID=889485 RepID=A0AAD6K5C8_9ROSI|nr:hypothetical protein OIU84_002997 [Salix udensis]